MRKLLATLLIVVLLVIVVVWQRHHIIIPLSTTGAPVAQITEANPTPEGEPFDGHFTVVQLDSQTYAIAEPYSWGRNVNYLILGERRALLFDAGVGHYDIRPAVESLTGLPLVFMPSHFHFDHTGQGDWGNVAMVDLPHLRARAENNRLQPTWEEHLGSAEAIELPAWEISEWVAPYSKIDLGGRQLTLLYTPGHANSSVSLYDEARSLVFTGDFLSNSGSLSAFLPTARLGDYLQSAGKVLAHTVNDADVVLRGAHASPANTIPHSTRHDLQILHDQLLAIRAGELQGTGTYPVVYVISEETTLSAEPSFLHNWTPTYPD